jgi:hypothetical protein
MAGLLDRCCDVRRCCTVLFQSRQGIRPEKGRLKRSRRRSGHFRKLTPVRLCGSTWKRGIPFRGNQLAEPDRKVRDMVLFDIIICPVKAVRSAFIPSHVVDGREEYDLDIAGILIPLQPFAHFKTVYARDADIEY